MSYKYIRNEQDLSKYNKIISDDLREQLLEDMKALTIVTGMRITDCTYKNESIRLKLDKIYQDIDKLIMYISEINLNYILITIDKFSLQNYLEQHSLNVMLFSIIIAYSIEFNKKKIKDLAISAILHDIGKVYIPDFILNKNSRFNNDDYSIVKSHPLIGKEFVLNYCDKNIANNDDIIRGILDHHERLDGSGYCKNLTGSQISYFGKIIAIADVFEAMLSTRPYKYGTSRIEALKAVSDISKFDANMIYTLEGLLRNKQLIIKT